MIYLLTKKIFIVINFLLIKLVMMIMKYSKDELKRNISTKEI